MFTTYPVAITKHEHDTFIDPFTTPFRQIHIMLGLGKKSSVPLSCDRFRSTYQNANEKSIQSCLGHAWSQGYLDLSISVSPFALRYANNPKGRFACWKIPQSVPNGVPLKQMWVSPVSQRSTRGLCCWSTSLSVRPRRTSVGQRPAGRHSPGRFD